MTVDPIRLMPPATPPAPSAEAREDAVVKKEFEAMLVRQLLHGMNLPGMEGQAAMFSDLLEESLARRIVESRGLGGPTGPVTGRGHAPHPRLPRGEGLAHVTSGFGPRSDPFHHQHKFHYGVDLGAPAGTPIGAARGGIVTHAGPAGTYGNLVIVDHGDGVTTRYAHCSTLDVAVGQNVTPGQRIGRVGSTGRSTGPHLHFEVRKGGKAIDPSPYLGGSQGSVPPIRLETTTTAPTGRP